MFVFLFLVECCLVIILCFKVLCMEICNYLFRKMRHIEIEYTAVMRDSIYH